MLPLLPALILLLLQGPSNLERLAVNGRLPAALEAIHRQMVNSESGSLGELEQTTFAGIFANRLNESLSTALLSLLQPIQEQPKESLQATADERLIRFVESNQLRTPDGFGKSDRTRDGPQ